VSTRFRFYVGEAVRSLRANLATTLAATVTVLIVMFFLGVFVALGSYLYAKVDQNALRPLARPWPGAGK